MKITEIAESYIKEHGELPILLVASNSDESRIIRGVLRQKHLQADQETFVQVMRLAMILYGYTSYEFIMKPTLNYTELEITKDVFAIGKVTAEKQETAFFEMSNDKFVPYLNNMPISGFISQLLPTDAERGITFDPKVEKQIRFYVNNATYTPVVAKPVEDNNMQALLDLYKNEK